ncbi:MAG TPA: hypothetical protein VHQ86_05815, partial [Candidatus Saccharimonadia bacterium]|nr:hypothetical protein [Candidatus Saccharimonadia bacterium]
MAFLGVRALVRSGKQAETVASAAMQKRAQQLLVQTTTATASKNSGQFSDVQEVIGTTAQYLQNIFDHPSDFSTTSWAFGTHIYRLPEGEYVNSATDPGNVYIQANFPFTPLNKLHMELSGYLDYLAPQVLRSQSNAVAIYYMGATAGESRYYPNIDLASIVGPNFDITSQEFFSVATPKNDPEKATKWTHVYDDPAGHGLLITATSPIYNDGQFSGAMGMDISLNNIAKNIE